MGGHLLFLLEDVAVQEFGEAVFPVDVTALVQGEEVSPAVLTEPLVVLELLVLGESDSFDEDGADRGVAGTVAGFRRLQLDR
ncbi:hypothetical protein OTC26_010635 [Streptomyces tirandamycinicus]|uniref:hypothetical protein n=1 Tax=Streptomyces tirandamycinicus TaxID=2174846 RepID=UPI00226F1F31|nr:hypothetical protein [Streptomyces tirandamycinicus]MCY0979579.1 hypothetical protein [Streptomyces tirandamycinicus]